MNRGRSGESVKPCGSGVHPVGRNDGIDRLDDSDEGDEGVDDNDDGAGGDCGADVYDYAKGGDVDEEWLHTSACDYNNCEDDAEGVPDFEYAHVMRRIMMVLLMVVVMLVMVMTVVAVTAV